MSHLAFIYFKRFICLVALGLSWGTWELPPSLLRAGFFFSVAACMGSGSQTRDQTQAPCIGVLATGPPGKSPHYLVFVKF